MTVQCSRGGDPRIWIPMTRQFVPVDHSRMELLAIYLRKVAGVEKAFGDADSSWAGSSGSVAASEASYVGAPGDPGEWSRTVRTAYATARLGLLAMVELGIAIARLISDPEIGPHGLLGVEACGRSAMESGSRAWWLLDPSIDARTRVARYSVDQLFSALQAERLDLEMGWRESPTGSPSPQDVVQRCDRLGLVVDLPRREVAGERRLESKELVTKLAAETGYRDTAKMIYPLLSGTPHGTIYALMRSYQRTDEEIEGEEVLNREADHRTIEAPAGLVLASLVVVLERASGLLGWPWYRVSSFKSMVNRVISQGPR